MALWSSLGQVATAAQLTGVDACVVVSMILEAVRTVRQNREECLQLARRTMMIGDLLRKLQGWDMMQDPEIRRPLDGLDDTLREAYLLVASCQESSIMYRFFMGWKQADRFREVQKKIDSYLQLYPFISHIDIPRRLDRLCNGAHPPYPQPQAAKGVLGSSTGHSIFEPRLDLWNDVICLICQHNICQPATHFAFAWTEGSGSGLKHTESQTIEAVPERSVGYMEVDDMLSTRKNKHIWCCWWLQNMTKTPYAPRFVHREGPGFPVFHFSDLVAATNNFSFENEIGRGGFGTVYKGEIHSGLTVAVKRCFSSGSSRDQKQQSLQFEAEIKVLMKLQHINIVKLLGYCIERRERILVYEYIPNGSLDKFIFGTRTEMQFDWSLRFRIIERIAQGIVIVYVHMYAGIRVLHRDLKPSNILLDSNMNPKITDFGLARILGDRVNEDVIEGTLGYIDPQYAASGRCSMKSDMYSFGIILLDIIAGSRRFQPFCTGHAEWDFVNNAWETWRAGRAVELIDPLLHDEPRMAEIVRCIQIAMLCVEPSWEDRPTMSEVIVMLSSESVVLPSPKRLYKDAYTVPSGSMEEGAYRVPSG